MAKAYDDRAKVDKVEESNTEIADSKGDKGDIANGTESQIDDVTKIDRDTASEAQTDGNAEKKNGDSEANVEQWTEAPPQQSQQPLQQYGRRWKARRRPELERVKFEQ